MKIDYNIIRKELEKLSKEEILNMCVVLPPTIEIIYRVYNLKKESITPNILFFEETPDQKIYNNLIDLKDFYDKNKRYPKSTSKNKHELKMVGIKNTFKTNIRENKTSKIFESWCKELNLWDYLYADEYPTIIQYSLQGVVVKIWKNISITDIALMVGASFAHLWACLNGKCTRVKNHIWRYEKDSFDKYRLPEIKASISEWKKYCKINNIYSITGWKLHSKFRKRNMPSDPRDYYGRRGEWSKGGWPEILETGHRNYIHFLERDIKKIIFKETSFISVASKYKCSIDCVRKKVKKYKIKNNIEISKIVTITKYSTTGEKIKEISGKSLKDISKIFKISSNKLGNCCKRVVKKVDGYIYRRNGDPFDKYSTQYKINIKNKEK